ncbi:DUF4352 domain-containing protein [Planomonospora sp. ID91781]|uniref:DUF4352 domain-containing protein n=1 Tax=Planomonospora sp. ID91781 TaxID=2738135 RepID=UPI0018C3C571|nr:DUF4352 domain-containing protein [Planomonospora sp. ID91781]MBG0819595.1 DUF4352 domain-containing protein [Planomonospora sp. ID91781]
MVGLSLALVVAAIGTIMAFGSAEPVSDDRLRTVPDLPQVAGTALPTADAQPTVEPAATQTPPANQQAQVAGIGETITVEGLQNGVHVAVTVTRVIDNATPANQYTKPQTGHRFAAIEITLKNVGKAVYNDFPTHDGTLIDAEGQQYRSTYPDITEGVSFGGAVTIAQGDERKGVIVFEVPTSAKLAKLQYGPAFGAQKGEWALS